MTFRMQNSDDARSRKIYKKPVQESTSMFVSRKVINYTDKLAGTWRGFSYERLSSQQA
jgi:hypothetical protein